MFDMPYYIESPYHVDNLKIEWKYHNELSEYLILIKDYQNNIFVLYLIELRDFDWTEDDPINAKNIVENFYYLPLEKTQEILPMYDFNEENYGLSRRE